MSGPWHRVRAEAVVRAWVEGLERAHHTAASPLTRAGAVARAAQRGGVVYGAEQSAHGAPACAGGGWRLPEGYRPVTEADRIMAHLAEINLRWRNAVFLVYGLELSQREAATELRVSRSTLQAWLEAGCAVILSALALGAFRGR